MTLSEFLLARIAEDEAAARNSPTHHWRVTDQPPAGHWASRQVRPGVGTAFVGGHSTTVVEVPSGGSARPGVEAHIARWDPARVLAECEAKRRIVEDATQGGDCQGHPGSYQPHGEYGPGYCRDFSDNQYLRLLALPYADHPDYREEWRP